MSLITPTDNLWGNWSLTDTEVVGNKLVLSGASVDNVYWSKLEDRTAETGNDFTDVGTPVYASGHWLNGLNCSTANTNLLQLDMDYAALNAVRFVGSIDFWIKTGATFNQATGAWVLSHTASGAGTVTMGMLFSTGSLWFIIGDNAIGGAGGRSLLRGAAHTFSANTEYHIQATWNKNNPGQKLFIYVDGVSLGTNETESVAWTSATWNSAFQLGSIPGTSSAILNVVIDNFRIWNVDTQMSAAQRNAEAPISAYSTSGTGSVILDMGEFRRMHKFDETLITPTDTTIKLETRATHTAPSGAAIGTFEDEDEYEYSYYNSWGTTTPGSYKEQTTDYIEADAEHKRYVELKYTLATTDTTETPEVELLSILCADYFDLGTFEISAPAFNSDINKSEVAVSGVDLIKKVLDKSITTIETAGTEKVSEFIESCLQQAGLTSAEYSIAATTLEVPVSGADTPLYSKSTLKTIFNECLEYLQIEDDYRMFVENDKITMAIIPTGYEADFGLTERYQITSGGRVIDDDNRIARITVHSQPETLKGEALFGSDAGAATGTKTIQRADFVYEDLRYDIVVTGDFTVVEAERNIDTGVAPAFTTQLKFTVAGTAGTYSITVYGCAIAATVGFIAESAGTGSNLVDSRGRYVLVVNKLIQSDTEAKSLADYYFNYFDNPLFKMTVGTNAIPQLQLNDNLLIFGEKISSNNLMVVESKSISYSQSTASLKQNIELIDNTTTIAPFVYDRRGYDLTPPHSAPGLGDLLYDIFMVWDWDLGAAAPSDTNTYPQPILFT